MLSQGTNIDSVENNSIRINNNQSSPIPTTLQVKTSLRARPLSSLVKSQTILTPLSPLLSYTQSPDEPSSARSSVPSPVSEALTVNNLPSSSVTRPTAHSLHSSNVPSIATNGEHNQSENVDEPVTIVKVTVTAPAST